MWTPPSDRLRTGERPDLIACVSARTPANVVKKLTDDRNSRSRRWLAKCSRYMSFRRPGGGSVERTCSRRQQSDEDRRIERLGLERRVVVRHERHERLARRHLVDDVVEGWLSGHLAVQRGDLCIELEQSGLHPAHLLVVVVAAPTLLLPSRGVVSEPLCPSKRDANATAAARWISPS